MTNKMDTLKKSKPRDANGKLIKIGGKGRVTKEVVAHFQKYYGKAICGHKDGPDGMKDAIMVYYHSKKTPQLSQRGSLAPACLGKG